MGLAAGEAMGAVGLSLGRLVEEPQIPAIAHLLGEGWLKAGGELT